MDGRSDAKWHDMGDLQSHSAEGRRQDADMVVVVVEAVDVTGHIPALDHVLGPAGAGDDREAGHEADLEVAARAAAVAAANPGAAAGKSATGQGHEVVLGVGPNPGPAALPGLRAQLRRISSRMENETAAWCLFPLSC